MWHRNNSTKTSHMVSVVSMGVMHSEEVGVSRFSCERVGSRSKRVKTAYDVSESRKRNRLQRKRKEETEAGQRLIIGTQDPLTGACYSPAPHTRLAR